MYRRFLFAAFLCLAHAHAHAFAASSPPAKEEIIQSVKKVHNLTDEQVQSMRKIFEGAPYIGQGNPEVTKHPMTREQCQAAQKVKNVVIENPEYEKICGAKYMAPLYDPSKEKMQDAKACIDQFEFPNIPCEYPVVWVQANEAEKICEAEGKRLCDAHEWEGACAGALEAPDYNFDSIKGLAPNAAINKMRLEHNAKDKKVWAYGPGGYKKGICAADSIKNDGCNGGDWKRCGSNTYPAGSFPDCKSKLDVYDQHGNAAEHMNLPLNEAQMTSKGSKELGHTEMKGSWFIFDKYQAHQDQCRWRAPYWHGTKVMDPKSHHNYHLGFRCCKTLN